MKKGKRYTAAVAARVSDRLPLEEAVAFVKQHAGAKFDETVEIHISLYADPKQSDQMVRGTIELPHGSPRTVRIAVFSQDPAVQDTAKEAGADIAGGPELIEDIRAKGDLNADVAVATPEIMKDLARIAKILGPRGLMPNPRNGTIGKDPTEIITRLRGGAVNFKSDAGGNVHVAIGKASWEEHRITENARSVIEGVRSARPAGIKGEYIRTISVSSTMGPSITVGN